MENDYKQLTISRSCLFWWSMGTTLGTTMRNSKELCPLPIIKHVDSGRLFLIGGIAFTHSCSDRVHCSLSIPLIVAFSYEWRKSLSTFHVLLLISMQSLSRGQLCWQAIKWACYSRYQWQFSCSAANQTEHPRNALEKDTIRDTLEADTVLVVS